MIIPFKFTFVTTSEVRALWNPYAVSTGIAGNNEILLNLVDPLIANLLPPRGSFCITGICVQTNGSGDAACTFGYYDTATAAFVALYPILTTAVAGGGATFPIDNGVFIPAGPTRVPAVRYDGAAGGVLGGHVAIHFTPDVSMTNDSLAEQLIPLFDEDNLILFDENAQQLFQS